MPLAVQTGRIAVVTGSAGGIGQAVCQILHVRRKARATC
jgi:NAD(P)-dependent dehydrogenase (short-subunit alcohol dehydrogenase family)